MPPPHLQEHVDLIARHEEAFFQNRTVADRVGDAIATSAGGLPFVIFHLAFFAGWILVNSLRELAAWRFDPYPYAMLDTVVALEAILLASFILMRQTRTGRRAEEREHLMLQLLLLEEKELTALLLVNRQMAEKLGLRQAAQDTELVALSEETSIDEVADCIKESLPET